MLYLDSVSRKLLKNLILTDANETSTDHFLNNTNIFKNQYCPRRSYHAKQIAAAFLYLHKNGFLDLCVISDDKKKPGNFIIQYEVSHAAMAYFPARRFKIFCALSPWAVTTAIAIATLIVSIKANTAIDLLQQLILR